MPGEEVSMRFAPGGPRLRIRELTGYVEQSVRDCSTAKAIGLMDRVVEIRIVQTHMHDHENDTTYTECSARQKVRFDIQYYLLQILEKKRKQIAREIHRLASAYQWSLAEILSLRRSERRAFVELIESESA